MAKQTYTEQESSYEHPSQSHSGRYSLDQLLRRHGWEIHSRPRSGEPLWRKRVFDAARNESSEVVLPQSKILKQLPKKEIEAARRKREDEDEQC